MIYMIFTNNYQTHRLNNQDKYYKQYNIDFRNSSSWKSKSNRLETLYSINDPYKRLINVTVKKNMIFMKHISK